MIYCCCVVYLQHVTVLRVVCAALCACFSRAPLNASPSPYRAQCGRCVRLTELLLSSMDLEWAESGLFKMAASSQNGRLSSLVATHRPGVYRTYFSFPTQMYF